MRKPGRRFWLGVLAGLSAAGLLRHIAERGLRQGIIRRVYQLWAPLYSLADLCLLGQLPHLRRSAVDRMQLKPGSSVLEISCGTGANFPLIQDRVGPSGRLVGIDYSRAMLEQARLLVSKQGWRNTELVQADAAALELDERFDAVLWVLAASVVPDWEMALERAVAHLKPRGWLVIADGRLSQRWYAIPFRWVADLMGLVAAADMGRRAWRLLPLYLAEIGYDELLLGFLYIAWGRMPAPS